LYLAYEYPVLTQTFTRAETVRIARAGVPIEVISCREPRERRDGDRPPTRTLPPPLSPGSVGALLFWLFRRPIRLSGSVFRAVTSRYRDQRFRCRLRGALQALWAARLAFELRRKRPKPHLHAQFVDAASTVAWMTARLLRTTFSVTNHTAYNPYLLRPKLREAARFFSISEFDRRQTLRMAGLRDVPNLRVIYQGLDLERFPRRADRDVGDPASLLSVAALKEKKGHHVLIRAAGILRDRGFRFRLTIVGEGAERPRLEKAIRDGGLESLVFLVGAEPPSRVGERLLAADLFVLACTTAKNGDLDGIPISLVEAMAVGVPVVSTRLSGIPELIEDGREGRLAEPDDAEGLADAVAKILRDSEGRRRMVEAAREKVERQHDLDRSVGRLLSELSGVRA
jgi:glycosyltransferase involved in cell wall biosynthesis